MRSRPGHQAAEVVGMGVRQDGSRQRVAAPASQLGREHARPHVDRAAHEAAPVDHEALPVGQVDDGAVALPHVEERRPEQPRGRARRGGRDTSSSRIAAPAPRAAGRRAASGEPRRGQQRPPIAASCQEVGCGRSSVSAGTEKARAIEAHDDERAGSDDGAALLRCRPPRKQRVDQAEGKRRRTRQSARRAGWRPPRRAGKLGAKRARIGAHATDAAIVVAIARATGATLQGTQPAMRSPRGPAKARRPPVAAAERRNDRSNATRDRGAPSRPSRCRTPAPPTCAGPGRVQARTAVAIQAARTVEPPAPASSAYTQATGMPTAATTRPTSTLAARACRRVSAISRRLERKAEDENEMHAGDREQVRQPADPEGSVVVRRENRSRRARGPGPSAPGSGAKVASIRRRTRARTRSIDDARPRPRRTRRTSMAPPLRSTPRRASEALGSPPDGFHSR